MDREIFDRLRTPEGQRLLTQACQEYAHGQADPLALSTRLRREHPADLVAAALTQARLRRWAESKFGSDARVMFFTADGLEQATTREVADYRATRLAAAVEPGAAALDLGCGLGGDLIALARAGLTVTGVELDPLTAEIARANLRALGLLAESDEPEVPEGLEGLEQESAVADDERAAREQREWSSAARARAGAGRARVLVADATTTDRTGYSVVIADPARRGARGRVFDPDAYAPPWSFVQRLLADRTAVTCVKTAPIIEHDRIEDGVTAEWVSLDGEVREAALWVLPDQRAGESAAGPRRRATVLRTNESPATLSDTDDPGEVDVADLTPTGQGGPGGPDGAGERADGEPPRYLYEPDGAVIRAGLVSAVAPLVHGRLPHPRIAYLLSDQLVRTPFARAYRIEEVRAYGQNQHKRLKRRLAELGVGRLTVKKRGVDVDPDEVRRRLVGSGPNSATLVLTRTVSGAVALLTQPIERR